MATKQRFLVFRSRSHCGIKRGKFRGNCQPTKIHLVHCLLGIVARSLYTMVRTKSDNGGRKAVAAKAPRKQLGGGGCSSGNTSAFTSPSGKNRNSGGNPVKWWPTPSWQKGVAEFFPKQTNGNVDNMNEDKMSGTSSTSISPDSSCVPSTSSLETCNPAASSKDLGIEPIED